VYKDSTLIVSLKDRNQEGDF
jgi:hypothetical protein